MSPARRRTPKKRIGHPRRLSGRAKVFWSGRSQAVRLPKEFRFDTAEVSIHREGERVILEPVNIERDARGWPLAWWELAGSAPEFDVGVRDAPHERNDVLTRGR
jgi:virulence-associated protein VagC